MPHLMPKKFKNFFSFFAKKKPFLLVFFFIILGIFYPLKPVLAGWVENLAAWITTRPIAFVVWVLRGLAILLVKLAGSILNWVLSSNFTTLSYTNPAGNEVIKVGLDVTRGFVNMLLVLVLVYIAIATILRLAGYETKKLLVTFIVVALLVNFAPIICGLIVDASNIVMNFFVQDLKADAFGKLISTKVETITNYDYTSDWHQIISSVIQTIVLTGFLFVLFFILLVFILIFVLRHLVIWVLVILSPLAFVCYILPATKKYWEMWWKQFLAWSFIGVTCGFFLYLGLLMVTLVPTKIPSPTTDQGPLFDSILPYYVSVVFLGLGVVFGLQTSAMGASSAINIAKTKGRAATRTTAKWAGRSARATAGRVLGAKGKRWVAKQATAGLPTFRGKSLGGKLLTGAYYAPAAAAWAARRGIGAAGLKLVETERKNVRQAEEKYKGTTAERKVSAIRTPRISTAQRIGALRQAIEEGQIKDLQNLGVTNEEITNIGKQALKTSPEEFKKIRDAFPSLAEEMGRGFSEKDRKVGGVMAFDDNLTNLNDRKISLQTDVAKTKPGKTKTLLEEELKKAEEEIKNVKDDKTKFGTIETKIVAKIKPEFIPKMAEGALKTDRALSAASQFWGGHQFKTAVESPGGKEFLEDFNKYVAETLKKKGKDFYKKNNYSLYKYSVSSAGSGLGIRKMGQ